MSDHTIRDPGCRSCRELFTPEWQQTMPKRKYVDDADGRTWEYRLTSSRLERRDITSSVWQAVCDGHYPRMTPDELRHIADVIERRHP